MIRGRFRKRIVTQMGDVTIAPKMPKAAKTENRP
jgi:hypothetical protein